MHFLWQELRAAIPLITHGNPQLIGRHRVHAPGRGDRDGRGDADRDTDRACARAGPLPRSHASSARPPTSASGSRRCSSARCCSSSGRQRTRSARCTSSSPGASSSSPRRSSPCRSPSRSPPPPSRDSPGCSARRDCSGAGPPAAARCSRCARPAIGSWPRCIAALGSALSEVAAVAILGGNIYGYDQTLASTTLYEVNSGHYPDAIAIAIVLIAMILVLMCGLGLLQQRQRPPTPIPARDVTARPAEPSCSGRGAEGQRGEARGRARRQPRAARGRDRRARSARTARARAPCSTRSPGR